jgi:hypothetical protein
MDLIVVQIIGTVAMMLGQFCIAVSDFFMRFR